MLYSLSTVCYSKHCLFVFLGRGQSLKIIESQEDQYLFEICPCKHCGHLHHQSGIFVFPISTLQLVSARLCSICCIYSEEACHCKIQSPEMPRTTKTSSYMMDNSQCEEDSSAHEESSSSEQRQDLQPSQTQVNPNIFMPYIEGPKMDSTVSDGLYHRFLEW